MNRGFTVVEVLITLVIIGILLGLGTVGLRSSLANGRDAERKSDIETIARGLEQRYNQGNLAQPSNFKKGTYPGSTEFWNGPSWHGQYKMSDVITNISQAALVSPSGQQMTYACLLFIPYGSCDSGNVPQGESNPSRIQSVFRNPDNTYKDIYVYEYLDIDTTDCDTDCVKFNLYWISEVDKTSYMGIPGLKVIRSKHRQ